MYALSHLVRHPGLSLTRRSPAARSSTVKHIQTLQAVIVQYPSDLARGFGFAEAEISLSAALNEQLGPHVRPFEVRATSFSSILGARRPAPARSSPNYCPSALQTMTRPFAGPAADL